MGIVSFFFESKMTDSEMSSIMEKLNLSSVIKTRNGIEENVLNCIGSTPLVRVNNIIKSENLKCDLLVKCEFFNAGGSVKDRIAYRMITKAEEEGKIKPGENTIIEPTSGNTGVGLALSCAVKGYRCIIVMPEKMSMEKVRVLKALGAEIIRTRNSAAFDDHDSHISIAKRLEKEIPGGFIPDQYVNINNPDAHYYGTGMELIEQTNGKIDVFVAGAGTGGTITGTAKVLKEHIPGIKVIGVDPKGSILAQPEELNKTDIGFYEVEGIGYDFIPDVLLRNYVDEWRKCDDSQSMPMARRLLREEGLLCGGSCGSAFYHALEVAKTMPEGTRVVCILPDSIRNYMTKHLMDEWMWERDFFTPPIAPQNESWYNKPVSSIPFDKPTGTLSESSTVEKGFEMMKMTNVSYLPIIGEDGSLVGCFSQQKCMEYILNGSVTTKCPVSKYWDQTIKHVSPADTIGKASRIVQNNGYVFVVENGCYLRTLHHSDILNYIA